MTRAELIVEREQLLSRTQHMEARIQELEAQLNWLLEQIKLAKHRQYGSSSENVAIQSELVFNEAESTLDSTPEVVETETITRVKKRKQPGHREEVLKDLPTETIEYRLDEEEQVCKQCGGHMHEMSTETREQIEMIPAQVKLIRHVRYVYGCRHCDRDYDSVPIVTAEAPKALIPKSLASASAVAYIMSQKFVEAMPLYRLEKHFERMGIELPRQNLSNWMMKGGEMLEVIYDRMHEMLLDLDILHADETTLQVLNEPGRSAQTKSYMWLYRSGRYGPPIVCYEYKEGRDGKYAARFLPAFSGYLQVDGHAGYHDVKEATLVGCWSHARRKFVDALVVVPKEHRKAPSLPSNIAIRKIKKLFEIERELRDATPEDRLAARNERSRPIVDEFKAWFESESKLALPKSALGKAFTYCKNQWPKLIRFLEAVRDRQKELAVRQYSERRENQRNHLQYRRDRQRKRLEPL